ncbi:pseudouridine synthase [Desulfovibrio sp. TomC]|uniref:pseudouridine synthase n=1 Tax=Desulfovibrio sp. TomC TaxID=1562888 RepID=UPI0005736FED|nr:pseudouridine synthase [Desulfovibrio sp. TomC]KHK02277.1 Ribosomal large subunit pseudouridine synthase D [Desulfovibrio sp. TomC]
MHKETDKLTIPATADGWRLDRVLELLLPDTGLRGRRRLVESGAVTVDGRDKPCGYRVRPGQELIVSPVVREAAFGPADVPVVMAVGDYAVVAKPAGLNTSSLAHGGGESVENLLPAIFPGRPLVLLSRLDRLTTGLLPVAFSDEAAQAYRDMEESGRVVKTYMAVGWGETQGFFRVENELDAADRRKTRVLARLSVDSLRMTDVEALTASGGATLFRCVINKGARHQIRAHLAYLGHPLVGDPLYGYGQAGERLFLHCAGIDCPAFTARLDAPWTLDDAVGLLLGGEAE